MSKIIFVQKEYEDKIGPMLLSAYLKAHGHEAEIVINPKKTIDYIRTANPDFIGCSVLSSSAAWALDICRQIKQVLPGCLTILGGPHPTYFPNVIEEDGIDIICRGEGERPLLNLLETYDGSRASITGIAGLWVKTPKSIIKNDVCDLLTEQELTDLPPCDRTLYDHYPQLRNNPHKTIITSRGCPNNCTYCFNHQFKALYKGRGKILRQRSVASVISELEQVKRFGWKCMEICDDQFILSKEWIFDFCEQYKQKIDLPFSCLSSAKQLTSDIVGALKKAGCSSISFAIESGVERIRKKVYNKPVNDSDIYEASEVLHSHKVPFQTFNMVGLPEETPQDIYQTVRINQEIKVTHPWCSIVQPYPGTKLAEYMRNQGVDLPAKFSPTFFQETAIKDPERTRLIVNTQRIFGLLVTSQASFDTFVRYVQKPPLGLDKLYLAVFYWYYGRSIRSRHKLSYPSIFRYWLYSLQG